MGFLTGISLFSGAGGLDLAARWAGIRTLCYVEYDKWAQGTLISRIREGALDAAPIWDDIKTFDGKPWHGKVDIVFGGFPCQPHSQAGKRERERDERNLWPEFMRIVRECRPPFILGENVQGIVTNGYAIEVMADLEEEGYCVVPTVGYSCAFGGPFPRARVLFIAHSKCLRWKTDKAEKTKHTEGIRQRESVAPMVRIDLGRYGQRTIPQLSRVVNGLAYRMECLKTIGNGVDPYVGYVAFQKILEMAALSQGKK